MKKRTLISLSAALFTAALWLGGLHSFTRDMTAVPSDMPPPADAIVVLTGGSKRLMTGFELLDHKIGKKLFISGVYRGVELKELMDQWKKGDKADMDCCVVLGFEADDTLGNARETIDWMKREGYTSAVLVTANYHVKRALAAFALYSGDDLHLTPYPVAPEGIDMANWWREPASRSLVLREYSKYIASLVLFILPESFYS